MKLSPLAQLKLAAVLAAAYLLLGCEAPTSTASEQDPSTSPTTVAPAPQPNLVTLPEVAPAEPAPAPTPTSASPEPTAEQPSAQAAPAAPVKLSDRLQEVVKLSQSGVGDDVIMAFVQNSPVAFSPTPEEIVYLTDVGLSDVVITALVNHQPNQGTVTNQPPPAEPFNPPPGPVGPPAGGQPGVGVAEATYNPEPQVVYGEPMVVQSETPPPTVDYNYFYSPLNPYGSWVEMPDYGWCWQPTVAIVQHDWRPYGDHGRWLYTDCGWYWHSDYSWGWAPFHYGRWFNHPGRGWCWRPDSVWAPAWVSWRYTDSYCGWAPLPPGAHFHEHSGFTYYGAHVGASFGFGLHQDAWTFVPARHFNDPEVWRHRVSPAEHQVLYGHSKVINNYVVNNHGIVNHGITPDRVPTLPRTEVRKVAVRDLPERGAGGVRPDRLHQNGAELVVYRPKPLAVTQPQNGRGSESSSARTIPEAPAADAAASRPNHALGVAPNSLATPSAGQRPTQPASQPSRLPSTAVASPRVEPTRPTTAQPVQSSNPTPGRPVNQLAPIARQEQQPTAVQTYRGPAPPTNPAFQRATPAAPQAVGQPTPAARQELAKPATTVAPEKYNSWSAPPPSGPPQRAEPAQAYRAPTPGFAAPAQGAYTAPQPSRAVPTYTPPPMQSRPAPVYSAPVQSRPAQPVQSYSAPAPRPAQQPAPAPAQTGNNNRRQY